MLFLSGIWIYFQKKLDQVDLGEGEGASSYAKHYLMIAGAENTLMWDSIYESASQSAKWKPTVHSRRPPVASSLARI